MWLHCDAVCEGGVLEGAVALALLSSAFQSLSLLPTIKLGPSGADSWVGGLVHALGPCGCLQQTLLWGWEFLPLPPEPPQVFSFRGLRLYFLNTRVPVWNPHRVRCWNSRLRGLFPRTPAAASLASCSFSHPAPQSATLLGLPGVALLRVLSTGLPVSAPPTGLDECFFFISLVVGLPYSLISCQFWLFFVFKLLSFFWLCEEAQCVYLLSILARSLSCHF